MLCKATSYTPPSLSLSLSLSHTHTHTHTHTHSLTNPSLSLFSPRPLYDRSIIPPWVVYGARPFTRCMAMNLFVSALSKLLLDLRASSLHKLPSVWPKKKKRCYNATVVGIGTMPYTLTSSMHAIPPTYVHILSRQFFLLSVAVA